LLHARTRLRALLIAATAIALTGTCATAAHAAPSKADLTKQIETLSNKLEDTTESYNKLNISMKKTIADEKALAASLAPARAALKTAGDQVNTMAASAYMRGQVGSITAILDGANGDLLNRMSYLDQLSRDRQRDINTYTATTQNYTTRQAELKQAQAKQAAQVKVLKATKKDIEDKIKDLKAKRTAAYGTPQERGTAYTGKIPKGSGKGGTAVSYAYGAIGKPYHYASDGPDSYDCSGLTAAAWNAAGISLPHNAAAQWSAVSHISKGDLQPGDLVFYRGLGHVAIYVGGGDIIHAPHTGTVVKKVSMMIMTPYGYGRP
jgi:cell wall-associated NlpC family hydrolase